jgi:hypothetical protein
LQTKVEHLIVIDEIRAVAATNKDNLQTNNAVFDALLKATTRTIMLDADVEVDAAVKDVVDDAYQPDEWHMRRYTRTALVRLFMQMDDMPALINRALEILVQGNKTLCAFRSKSKMLRVLEGLVVESRAAPIVMMKDSLFLA